MSDTAVLPDAEQLVQDLAKNHGHVPVMRGRVTELLAPALRAGGQKAILVDGTLGAGGHTEHLLQSFPQLRVIGVDRDAASLQAASERLAPCGDRFTALHCRFDGVVKEIVDSTHPVCQEAVSLGLSGALFDLGVSSMQLDQLERGFAYRADAPLDMRMDTTQELTAAQVLNTYSHGQLAHILKVYGDERFAGKIATAIVKEREREPFENSGRLVELLYAVIPAAARRTGGHPAKRTFQALRIEVNGELEALDRVIPSITGALAPGGRAVFMSYQSLEDRLVKQHFADLTTSRTPSGLPMELPGYEPQFKLVTKGAEKASVQEIESNPRAASVRVRAIEKLSSAPIVFGEAQ